MDYLDKIRLIALANVSKGDLDYYLRRVRRWYSKTFSTPLSDVDDIPQDDLLITYYESRYEELNSEELKIEIQDALLTPEERKKMEQEELIKKVSDEEFFKSIKEAELKKKRTESEEKAQAEKMEELARSMKGLAHQMSKHKEALSPPKLEIPREIPIVNFDDLPDDEPGTAFGIKLKPKKPQKP